MDLIYLDRENIENYTDYLTGDIAENIGRTYYHGLVVVKDEEPCAGIVWVTKNTTNEDDNVGHIVFLRIDDKEAEDILFDNYKLQIAEDEVKKSTFSIPAMTSEGEKKALLSRGFTVELMEGDVIRTRISDVTAIKKFKHDDSISSISALDNREFAAAVRRFFQMGMKGICEDLVYLPKTYFENEVSCYVESEGQVNGMLLLHKNFSGALVVILMGYIGNSFAKYLPHLMGYAAYKIVEVYGPDTEVLIDRHNYSTLALAEKLFPSGFGIPMYQGERSEE